MLMAGWPELNEHIVRTEHVLKIRPRICVYTIPATLTCRCPDAHLCDHGCNLLAEHHLVQLLDVFNP